MIRFTSTNDNTISKHDMQFCKPLPFKETYLTNGGIICYEESYLQTLRGMIGVESIYLDFETGSYDSSLDSLNPWKHCWIIGIAISADDGPAYYIPVDKDNEGNCYDILHEIFHHKNCKQWVNHNIKYDAHVLANNGGVIPPNNVKLIDTLTLAKLIDSDRFRYGLDALSLDWLEVDIKPYEEALRPYRYHNNRQINKDYSQIPVDIIAPYACQDVITVKQLYKYICDNLPEQCNYVRDIEIELTRILFNMERNGMRTDLKHLQHTEIKNLSKLIEIEEKLESITGRPFRPHVNSDCFDILCNFYGLPILKFTDDKDEKKMQDYLEAEESLEKDDKPCNASFDKFAIAAYLAHPIVIANPNIKAVVELIAEYRRINTFNNLFVKQYQEQITVHNNPDDGSEFCLLHPFYNQAVRTGRMACKHPNAQQLDENAKELILPYIGHRFVSYDFSQIEYRTIAHYVESERIINAYINDPDVDFHTFVADLIKELLGLEITRKVGKTLNFGLSFGMGKKKLLRSLIVSLTEIISSKIESMNLPKSEQDITFKRLAEQMAESVYLSYHKIFPEIKRTSYKAQAACEYRGYIFNLFGGRRHLPYKFAYRAFNTVNQSSAAYIMKERMVYIGSLINDTEIKLVASVHDEVLFSMPERLAEDKRILHTIANLLEHPIFPPEIKFAVPIRVSCGTGNNWKEANKSAKVQIYDQAVSEEEFLEIVNGNFN